MKCSKKLLALVLAMVLAFSLMAVTAAAYDAGHEHDCMVCSEDEGIMPLGPVGPLGPACSICGAPTVGFPVEDKDGNIKYVYRCIASHI